MKLAVQLYTLRGQIKNGDDMLAMLGRVKELGFQGVEFAGYYGLTARQLRDRLDELELGVAGTHLSPAQLEGERLRENMEFVKTLGSGYIGTGGMPFAGKRGSLKAARVMSAAFEAGSREGLCAYYHNHWREFKRTGDEYRLDIITSGCALELDTYWSFYAGVDTPDFIRSHADKVKLIHIKDGPRRKPMPCALGEGENDLEGIIRAGRDIGCEWLILENDMPKPDGLADITRSMEYLKKHI